MLARIDKLLLSFVRDESLTLYRYVCQVLSVCTLLKFISVFQVYKTGVSLDALMATVSLLGIVWLFFSCFIRVSSLFLSAVLFLSWNRVLFEDSQSVFNTHHVQLLILMLLSLSLFEPVRSDKTERVLRGAGFQLIRFTIITVYLGGLVTKLVPSYLNGHQLEMLFLQLYWGSDWIDSDYRMYFKAIAFISIATEAIIIATLLSRNANARKTGVIIGMLFHAILYVTLPVSVFSFLMMIGLALFWPSDEKQIALDSVSIHDRA